MEFKKVSAYYRKTKQPIKKWVDGETVYISDGFTAFRCSENYFNAFPVSTVPGDPAFLDKLKKIFTIEGNDAAPVSFSDVSLSIPDGKKKISVSAIVATDNIDDNTVKTNFYRSEVAEALREVINFSDRYKFPASVYAPAVCDAGTVAFVACRFRVAPGTAEANKLLEVAKYF